MCCIYFVGAPTAPHHISYEAQKAVHQGDLLDRGYSREHGIAGAYEGMKELIQVDRWNATALNLSMLGLRDDIPRIVGRFVKIRRFHGYMRLRM